MKRVVPTQPRVMAGCRKAPAPAVVSSVVLALVTLGVAASPAVGQPVAAKKLGKRAAPTKGAPPKRSARSPRPHRPAIKFNRWQEDWSVLANPALRTEPLDDLKYIPFGTGHPEDYASLGLSLRERFEDASLAPFGIGKGGTNGYLLQRLEVHLDLHPDENWQIFTQLQDDREFGKKVITPVDEEELGLEQGFVTYSRRIGANEFKIRAGRQEMAFDLQRFVAVRDGPNVRQAFDALWLDWERGVWRVITSGATRSRIGIFGHSTTTRVAISNMAGYGWSAGMLDRESCPLTSPAMSSTTRTISMRRAMSG